MSKEPKIKNKKPTEVKAFMTALRALCVKYGVDSLGTTGLDEIRVEFEGPDDEYALSFYAKSFSRKTDPVGYLRYAKRPNLRTLK